MKCDDIVYEAANAFVNKEYDRFKSLVSSLYNKHFPDVKVKFYPVRNTDLNTADIVVTVLPTNPLAVVVYYKPNNRLEDDDVTKIKYYILVGLILIYRAKKLPVKISDRFKNFLSKENILVSIIGALFLSPVYYFISTISKKKVVTFLVLELITFLRVLYEIGKNESTIILKKLGCEKYYMDINLVIKEQQKHLKDIKNKLEDM